MALFMNNAIRWLIQDPELELVRLELSDDAPIPGTTVQMKATVFDTNYQPASNFPVEVTVKRRASPMGEALLFTVTSTGKLEAGW